MSDVNIQVIYGVIFFSITTSIVALVYAVWMHKKVQKIFRSANVSDIEQLLALHARTVEDLVVFKTEAKNYMGLLDQRIKQKLGSTKTMRFNPFQGEGFGGNQSFTAVFADENGDGVVVTSMHTRERTNVFAKPLKQWKSEYELGSEEQETIEKAKTKN